MRLCSNKKCLPLFFALTLVTAEGADLGFFTDEFTSCPNGGWSERRTPASSWSCTDRPGWLRYSLLSSTHPSGDANAFWVFRDFLATRYAVSFRVQYSVPSGTGRQLYLRVLLGGTAAKGINEATFWRQKDDAGSPSDYVVGTLVDRGTVVANATKPKTSSDIYYVRIERQGQTLTIKSSSDGINFTNFASRTFQTKLGALNTIMLSAAAFGHEGGRADYDWIRVEPLP